MIKKLGAILLILRSKNFILLHSIEEMKIQGKDARKVGFLCRTDYNSESDFYSMKGAMYLIFGKQILDENNKIGDFIPKEK